jgi:hypothetical protein
MYSSLQQNFYFETQAYFGVWHQSVEEKGEKVQWHSNVVK